MARTVPGKLSENATCPASGTSAVRAEGISATKHFIMDGSVTSSSAP